MKKLLLASSMVALLATPAFANEDTGSYITGGAGWSFNEDRDDSLVVGGAVGHDWGHVRGDVGYDAYLEDDLDGHLLSANVYLEATSVDGPLTPFIGAGVGYLFLDGTDAIDDDDVAYMGTAGLRYNFTEAVGVEGSYRYVHSDAQIVGDNGGREDYVAHTVMGRLSYRF